MAFIACGLNHNTADIAIREKLSLSNEAQQQALEALLNSDEINEAAILSTCNRTEFYCDLEHPDAILNWLAEYHQLAPEQLNHYLYLHQDQQAIQHMLRVAVGVDSMMLGEPQILGQMKQAFQQASAQGAIGSQLHTIFQFLFGASKRIRNQSGIGHHAISIAYAASQLIQQRFNNPTEVSVLLIGSGETATLLAKYLHQQGIRRFMVASRTKQHATELASLYQADSIPIQDLDSALSKADVVVSATACPLPFITSAMVSKALLTRDHAPMFFLDLAIPRDIEPSVGDLDSVDLYNIDQLYHLTQQGKNQRQAAAHHAEQLIALEIQNFSDRHRSLRAKDLICSYRNTMEAIADIELQRASQQLAKGQSATAVLSEFSQRLIKKFTHHPTIGLRQAALDQRDDVLDLAHSLFQLNKMNHEKIT